MIYQLGIFDDIGFTIEQSIRSFFGWISAQLYSFIINLYNLFMILARAQILDSTYIQKIYTRIGMILGLFMIFKLSFSLIQSLIEPEKLTDKKNGFGNIIMRCVISIVLLGITPSLFKLAFKLQNTIVGTEGNNIIYRMISPDDESINVENFGRTLAVDLYFCFFRETNPGELDGGYEYKDLDGNEIDVFLYKKNYETIKQSLKDGSIKDFNNMTYYLTLRKNGHYVISWDFLFSPVVALAVIWILITYCISISVRVFQLAYLQLIAPIPILSYISDPEGTFKNWIKQCTTTYLDLFIRLAIIYFIITLSDLVLTIMNDDATLLDSTGISQSDGTYIWVKIFLIIGLLMFGKRVPDLLKDLFPNMGGGAASLGFGIKGLKKTFADVPLLGGAANKVLGYTGNLGKKVGKFAWDHTGKAAGNAIWKKTGGKLKTNYDRWKDDRTGYKEGNKQDLESKNVWDKYGKTFSDKNYKDAFKNNRDSNGEFAASYEELTNAKENMKRVIADGYTRDSKEYMEAEKAVNDAQKNHDINREKYKDLARREDQLKRYKNRHPSATTNAGSNQDNKGKDANQAPPRIQNNQQRNVPVNQNNSVFANITNGTDDGNPYETGHSQFDAASSKNNNVTNGTDDGNPYETGHSQFTATSGGNNSDEDDNPYVNPNYYNDNSQNTNNSNDNDEFDGSNYY